MSQTSARQWREAALALRNHAAIFEGFAARAEAAEEYAICGVVSESGPNHEPLACGWRLGHDGDHAWASLPTFTAGRLPVQSEQEGVSDDVLDDWDAGNRSETL